MYKLLNTKDLPSYRVSIDIIPERGAKHDSIRPIVLVEWESKLTNSF